jgi:hypothetical protein
LLRCGLPKTLPHLVQELCQGGRLAAQQGGRGGGGRRGPSARQRQLQHQPHAAATPQQAAEQVQGTEAGALTSR